MAERFQELDPRARRRLVARTGLRAAANVLILCALYVVAPVAGESGPWLAIWLMVAGAALLGVVAWLLLSIVASDYPTLRAIEALALILPVTIFGFAYTYLAMWHAHHGGFSEPLDHIGSVYFTVTVLTTVGFGDIVARTDGTRLVVTLQMVLDLVLLAFLVRMFVFAVQTGVRRRESERSGSPAPEQGEDEPF